MKKYLLLCLLFFACQKQTSQTHPLDDITTFHPDPYFKAAMVSMHFVKEVSPIADVEYEFQQMIARFGLPQTADSCADGTYIGDSPYDAFDYHAWVQLSIKDEKIIDLDYNEIYIDGTGKQEDKTYCKKMSVAGTDPSRAYPIYEHQFLQKQNLQEMDAVTGASYSLYRFRYAAMVALMKARLAKQNN